LATIFVCRTNEIEDLEPKLVTMPGRTTKIAVYRLKGSYYAYLDLCPHQGGPACEGMTIGHSKGEILDNGKSLRRFISSEEFNIACPWHGIEFDLASGVCVSRSTDRLRSYEVLVENGEVKVRT
jgi:nitrite reductase (NADH) small subunit